VKIPERRPYRQRHRTQIVSEFSDAASQLLAQHTAAGRAAGDVILLQPEALGLSMCRSVGTGYRSVPAGTDTLVG
jgi:hypothetical protein